MLNLVFHALKKVLGLVEKLKEQGFAVDKRRVELEEPIKMVGIYKVPVRLEAGVVGEVRVWVVKE